MARNSAWGLTGPARAATTVSDPLFEARPLLHAVNSPAQIGPPDRNVAVAFALQRSRHGAQDRGGNLGLIGHERERGIGKKSVAGANGIDHVLGEAVHHEE